MEASEALLQEARQVLGPSAPEGASEESDWQGGKAGNTVAAA